MQTYSRMDLNNHYMYGLENSTVHCWKLDLAIVVKDHKVFEKEQGVTHWVGISF